MAVEDRATKSGSFNAVAIGAECVVTTCEDPFERLIASGLAESGAAVVINGRSQGSVEAATARLAKKVPPAKIAGVAADLATASGVEAFLARAGEADILVNNLGIFEPKPFFDIDDGDWRRCFEVNVLSGIRLSRAYAQAMAKRGWGRIIHLGSILSAIGIAGRTPYASSKAGLLGLTRTLASELGPHNIRVNALCPSEFSSA